MSGTPRGALVLAALLGVAGDVRAETTRRFTGTAPRALAAMAPAGRAPADLRLEYVTVFLGLRDRDRLDALLAAQQDRHSPHFRRWLDPTEIADRFGARRARYERVRRWFADRGFDVVRDSPYRASLVVAGTAAQVEAALAAPIGLFRGDGRTYHGPLAEPVLPESLAVRGFLGLDDLPKFHPHVRLDDGQTALSPQDFARAYAVEALQAAGLTGAGRSIAVVARSNFRDSDVAAFAARFVGAPPRVVRTLVGQDPGILTEPREEIEVLLDTQWAGALAPGAIVNVVIGTREGNIPQALDEAVANREGDVVTVSFGLCEPAAPVIASELFDALYAIGNLQGQTVVVSSGDGGGHECAPQDPRRIAVSGLASSPHAVAVGGTSFALDANGNLPPVLAETVWNDDLGASGGGRSGIFALPRYQMAAGLAGLSQGRALPDLAVAASVATPGYAIVQGGRTVVVGGTSAGAQAMGSVLALVNEQLARTMGTNGLGQLLPSLYRLASEQTRGLRPAVFRDVTTGSNGEFAAGPGFDLATGWGAPLAAPLAAALAGPGRCEPEIPCLVPARGPKNRACAAEWLLEQDVLAARRGIPLPSQSCRDGDPQCDADGAVNGRCVINVALCLNVFDFRTLRRHGPRRGFPLCEPGVVRRVHLLGPRRRRHDPTEAANRAALRAALGTLPTRPTRLDAACTATVPIVVPAGGRTVLGARADDTRGATTARVRLRCTAP